MEAKKQEKNLTLVIFILEACGALAMKGYDDIEQTGLWWKPWLYLKLANFIKIQCQ